MSLRSEQNRYENHKSKAYDLIDPYRVRLAELVDEAMALIDLETAILSEASFSAVNRDLQVQITNALEEVGFFAEYERVTLSTIGKATYIKDIMRDDTIAQYSEKLSHIQVAPNKVGLNLSQQIRKTSRDTIAEARHKVTQGIRQAKSIQEMVKDINANVGFKEELPKYLRKLDKIKYSGNINYNALRKQANKLVTPDLKYNYNKLINASELGKDTTKLIENAVKATVDYKAEALARSEMNACLFRQHNSLQIQQGANRCRSYTTGVNPCARCIGIEALQWFPVTGGLAITYHTQCSCEMEYSMQKEPPITESSMLRKLEKAQAKAEKQTGVKIYLDEPKLSNLTEDRFLERLGY